MFQFVYLHIRTNVQTSERRTEKICFNNYRKLSSINAIWFVWRLAWFICWFETSWLTWFIKFIFHFNWSIAEVDSTSTTLAYNRRACFNFLTTTMVRLRCFTSLIRICSMLIIIVFIGDGCFEVGENWCGNKMPRFN